jgi:hypothetical protein
MAAIDADDKPAAIRQRPHIENISDSMLLKRSHEAINRVV